MKRYQVMALGMALSVSLLWGCGETEAAVEENVQTETVDTETEESAESAEAGQTEEMQGQEPSSMAMFSDEAVGEEDIEAILAAGRAVAEGSENTTWALDAVTDTETLQSISGGMGRGLGGGELPEGGEMPEGMEPPEDGGQPGGEGAPSGEGEAPGGGQGANPAEGGEEMPEGREAPSGENGEGMEELAEGEMPEGMENPEGGQRPGQGGGFGTAPLAIVLTSEEGETADADGICQAMTEEAEGLGYLTSLISLAEIEEEQQESYRGILGLSETQDIAAVLLVGVQAEQ